MIIEGMKELEATIKTLEKLPQKCVNVAVRKAIVYPKNYSKQGGWLDQTGNLRRGIISKAEKKVLNGKKVYDVMMNPKMNAIFQKKTVTGRILKRVKGNRFKSSYGNYYYPSSQEFGFRTKNGGYVPGFHFLRDGLINKKGEFERVVIKVMSDEIDKLK